MIGRTLSHYKIVEKLGEGGMGVVYRATDTRLDRQVAIKLLPPHLSADESARTRFIREAKAASALEHPNICSIYEIDQAPDGRLFTVMPCYEGETLHQRLERGPLDATEALDIATQVARGLSRAHEKGIIHRDIKPGNVMLTDGGRQAKLMDFGLAKKLDATKVTRTGTTVGTVAYMSPEQALGKDTDHRTDIWSLGVVLYEMLTGRLPFVGDVEPAILYSIINTDPEPVTKAAKDVPVEVDRIIERALEKNPEDRYPTMDAFLADLEQQLDHWVLGIKRRRILTVRRRTRKRVARAASAVGIVAAVVAAYLVFKPGPPPEVIARENSMAIMYFENLSDPEDDGKYGEMITSLISTDLGESDYMRVVNRQRIYDILKQMGREKQKVIDKGIASEVAKKAHVNWVVTGNVIQTEPNIVVTSEISHAVTGEVRASQRVRGEPGENILDVADKLSAEIRKDFALPKAAREELDRAVADITTSSPEAYLNYVEGVQHWSDFEWKEAAASFNKAIELDSTFAMAYLELARTVWLQGAMDYTTMSARELCEKAVEYSDGVSWREKREIEGMHGVLFNDYNKALTAYSAIVERDPDDKAAWHRLGEIHRLFTGNLNEAIPCYERELALDSLGTAGYHGIAYASAGLGELDKALWAGNKLVELDPDQPDPYDSRGDVRMGRGEVDEALVDFLEAEKRSKHYSIPKIALIHMFRGDYPKADSIVRECITGGVWSPKGGRRFLAYIPMCQGRFEYALTFLDNAIAADQMEAKTEEYDKHALKGIVHAERGEIDEAIEELDKANELKAATGGPPWYFNSLKVCFLTDAGRLDEARGIAESIRKDMIANAPRTQLRPDHMPDYWRALGAIELATGESDSAVVHLNKAVEQSWPFNFDDRFYLGRAYLEAGRLDDAIRELTACTTRFGFDTAYVSPWWARSHYLLGRACEAAGRTDEAAKRYEQFLDIWKDADSDLPVLADAHGRLARLKKL